MHLFLKICIAFLMKLVWTRALNARSEASLSEASLSEASSSAGLRNSFSNSFSISFSIIRSAPWKHFSTPRGFGASIFEHFSTSRGFGASIFERFSTSGGFGASIFEHFRRLEASERAFSSIFDVWRLRSEDFRGFSRRAAPAPPAKSPRRQSANRSLRNFRIDSFAVGSR